MSTLNTNPSGDPCDTTSITYYKTIQPIIRAICYTCHGDSSSIVTQQNGLNLEDTTSLKTYLLLGFRGDNIYGSKLYHCILHAQFALSMPPSYLLDSCSILKIKKWIDVGAPIK
jgi:hypothetical protein